MMNSNVIDAHKFPRTTYSYVVEERIKTFLNIDSPFSKKKDSKAFTLELWKDKASKASKAQLPTTSNSEPALLSLSKKSAL